jgi:ethylbenzene dioxygenase subunit beta
VGAGERVVSGELAEVERFLHLEARLLDAERYLDWLALLTDDVHYWVPGVENRNRTDAEGPFAPGRMAHFDDGWADLERRIVRFTSETAWSENPPTRHIHVVSNVEVEPAEREDELRAHSLVVVHRGRYEASDETLYGRREDVLRRVDGDLRLARRRVILAHNILPSKNLNTFL